jgi:hypothetical protein
MSSRLKISRKLRNFRLYRGELRITVRQDQTSHIFSEMSLVDTLDVSYKFFFVVADLLIKNIINNPRNDT